MAQPILHCDRFACHHLTNDQTVVAEPRQRLTEHFLRHTCDFPAKGIEAYRSIGKCKENQNCPPISKLIEHYPHWAWLIRGRDESGEWFPHGIQYTFWYPIDTGRDSVETELEANSMPIILGVELTKVEANGITVQVAVGGEGPAILLLHGWPFNWFVWNRVLPTLVAAGHQVIAPDLRGIGGTTQAKDGYDIITLAEDAFGLLQALGAQDVTAVGFDLGLQSALMLALRHPEVVRRLVLSEALAGSLPGAEDFLKAGAPWWFGFHAMPGLAESSLVGNEAAYLNWFYEHHTVQKLPEASRSEYVRAYTGYDALRGGFEHYRAFALDAKQLDQELQTKRLLQPTLVIGGGIVKDAPYKQLKPFTDRIDYREIANCGHVVPEEQPEEFASLLLDLARQ